jgi:hypothetical protein
MGVTVAVGINDAVGVTVGWGARDEHPERINVSTRRTWMGRAVLFCMGCILAKKLPMGDSNGRTFKIIQLAFD